MTDTEREHLITNIVNHVNAGVQPRVIEYWASIHYDLGAHVSKQLNGG